MSPPRRAAVIDYGCGNLRSVVRALERSGLDPRVTDRPEGFRDAHALVLPGVGNFSDAVAGLEKRGLTEPLRDAIQSGRPYLGICLGLQLLFERSLEHGESPGFGLLRGEVRRFPDEGPGGTRLRVPHIGWNEVRWSGSHPLLRELPERDCYYFVHSYRAEPAEADLVVGWCEYGKPFAAAVARENAIAVQFHPEKSQNAGRRLLDAFARWVSA